MSEETGTEPPRGARPAAGAVLLCGAIALIAGCPRGDDAATTPVRQSVRVRSFTEPAPVRVLASVPPYAFVGTSRGLDRWDLRSGEGLFLSAEHGLPGDRIDALAHDAARGWLWVATDRGVARYEMGAGTFTEHTPAPRVLGLESLEGAALAPADDGGLWIGHPRGLFYTNTAGQWTGTGITEPVTALWASPDGWLWIGTGDSGVLGRRPDGDTIELGVEEGCDLARVRFITRAPDGGPVIVGDNAAGKQRIAFYDGERCATFRASPDVPWTAAAATADGLVILAPPSLYTLRLPSGGARRLRREGMRLVPVSVGPEGAVARTAYVLRAVELPLPAGARELAAVGDEILVGTRDLGVARLITGRRRGRTQWLRRKELVDGARSLSVACAARDDCYLATGSVRAWRFDGETFRRTGDGDEVLAVVREPRGGAIYALHHGVERQAIVVSRIVDGTWEPVSDLIVETPDGRPELSFSRFSPAGILWLGLRYRDDTGEVRPYGVALVDVRIGAVAYHHASVDQGQLDQGVLPIPVNVIDASFMDDEEVWMATSEGAARLRGQDIEVFSEAEGLRSELLRGVACSAGGMVYVASGAGVGSYDGEQWAFPPSLGWPVNDLEIGPDGRLWMATDRGIAVFDGARVRRLDTRRGMLENQIDDVAIDTYGRIWARGPQGFTLVVP